MINSPSFHALLQMGNESLTSGMNSEVVSVKDLHQKADNQEHAANQVGFTTEHSLISNSVGQPKYEQTLSSLKNMNVYQTPMKIRVIEKSVLEQKKAEKDPRDLVIESIHK